MIAGNLISQELMDAIRAVSHHRVFIAMGIPLMGGALVVATSVLTPLGKGKGIITGAYLFLACLGAASLVFALLAALAGEPRAVYVPLFVPGIALTVIMGLFSPEIIREYQKFELRKLDAELFRRG
jgi:hypothetical protein